MFGWIVILYANFEVHYGLWWADAKPKNYIYLCWGIWLLIVLFMEILYWAFLRYRSFEDPHMPRKKTMTMAEFNDLVERRRPVCLYNNHVVNFGLFAMEHPGGSQLL